MSLNVEQKTQLQSAKIAKLAAGPVEGDHVFIRTVSVYYDGVIVGVSPDYYLLGDAIWIMNSSEELKEIKKSQYGKSDKYLDTMVWIARQSIVEVMPISLTDR